MRRSSCSRAGSIGSGPRVASTLPSQTSRSQKPDTLRPARRASMVQRKCSSGVSRIVTVLLRGAVACVRCLGILLASSRLGSGRGNRALTGGVRGSGGALSSASGICKRLPRKRCKRLQIHISLPHALGCCVFANVSLVVCNLFPSFSFGHLFIFHTNIAEHENALRVITNDAETFLITTIMIMRACVRMRDDNSRVKKLRR